MVKATRSSSPSTRWLVPRPLPGKSSSAPTPAEAPSSASSTCKRMARIRGCYSKRDSSKADGTSTRLPILASPSRLLYPRNCTPAMSGTTSPRLMTAPRIVPMSTASYRTRQRSPYCLKAKAALRSASASILSTISRVLCDKPASPNAPLHRRSFYRHHEQSTRTLDARPDRRSRAPRRARIF
jgi:hypothetical protein